MQYLYPYPPIIGLDELSILLKRNRNVLVKDKSERPHTVPPAQKPKDTKNPLWVTEDVIAWLREHPEHPEEKPQTIAKMGAPTKRERIAKREALALNEGAK